MMFVSCAFASDNQSDCSFDAKFNEFMASNDTLLALNKEVETRYQQALKQQNAKSKTISNCQWVNEIKQILARHDYENIFIGQKDKLCEFYKELFDSYGTRLNHLGAVSPDENIKTDQSKFTLYSEEMGQTFLNKRSLNLTENEINTPVQMKVIKIDGQAYFGECGDVGLKVITFADKQAKIKNDLLDTLRTKELIQVIKDPYQMPSFIQTQFKDNNYTYDYSESLDYLDDRILSLTTTTYNYSGGAHGNTAIEKLSFDLERQKPFTLEEIFSQHDIPGLMKLAKKQFLTDLNLSPEKSWEELGYWFKKEDSAKIENKWLLDDGFYLPKNFNLDNEGITFLYQSYEVTCYACGIPEFKLKWKDLGVFLAKDSIANRYISKKS